MKIAYFDCFAGISGDMILGALLDAGLDLNLFIKEIQKLNIGNIRISTEKVTRNGISGTKVHISTTDKAEHRHLEDIKEIINTSTLNNEIITKSIAVFQKLAETEAKIHNTTIDKIHFHEVGALDTIIDITGTITALYLMGLEKISASRIHIGTGFVHCQHGKIPVPSPATSELLKQIPVFSTGIESELTTPTGAALISSISKSFGMMPGMNIKTIGYGAGSKKLEIPNLLRVYIGEESTSGDKSVFESDQVFLLETNIDDMSPEILSYLMDKLFAIGALDVYFSSIQMKKNRPGIMLSAIVKKENLNSLLECIFKETSTLGIRTKKIDRKIIKRKTIKVNTEYGSVDVKVGYLKNKIFTASPEYEDCKKIAEEQKIPLKDIFQLVKNEINLKQ
ncbi:MAG: nickel pincer cofactor biosynthesis protein LarC [Armatimonadetes bacterium]|nr:nickel pincer cofactor biosynthesis protein LarC [Armatimonadota bacterium]